MNTKLDELADRHMRADPDGALRAASEVKPGWVRVIVQPGEAEVFEGQCAAWMVVNLVARQFKVVTGIQISAPSASLTSGIVPDGTAGDLATALINWGRHVAGTHIDICAADDAVEPAITIVIGCEKIESAGHIVYMCARRWSWYTGVEPAPAPTLRSDANCIGAFLGATQVAGEVFKLFRGLKPGKGEMITRPFYASAWTMSEQEGWPADACPSMSQLRAIGHVYLPGAGAVGQAAGLVMGVNRLPLKVTAIDNDKLDTTNGNRYCLAGLEDGGAEKAKFLAHYLGARGIACKPAVMLWSDYFRSNGNLAIDHEVKELEQHKRFPLVLSCVDKIFHDGSCRTHSATDSGGQH